MTCRIRTLLGAGLGRKDSSQARFFQESVPTAGAACAATRGWKAAAAGRAGVGRVVGVGSHSSRWKTATWPGRLFATCHDRWAFQSRGYGCVASNSRGPGCAFAGHACVASRCVGGGTGSSAAPVTRLVIGKMAVCIDQILAHRTLALGSRPTSGLSPDQSGALPGPLLSQRKSCAHGGRAARRFPAIMASARRRRATAGRQD